MKKFLLSCIIFMLSIASMAYAYDGWENFTNLDRAWDGQQSITNKEFDDVINALEEKKTKKDAKQKKKRIKKVSGGGTSLHSELNPDNEIKNLVPLDNKDQDGHLLNVPVALSLDNQILEEGFYKIIGEKNKNGIIEFLFYQSQYFKGKISATETEEDDNEENVNFVKLIPINDNYVKILYGSLDFNAKAFLKIAK